VLCGRALVQQDRITVCRPSPSKASAQKLTFVELNKHLLSVIRAPNKDTRRNMQRAGDEDQRCPDKCPKGKGLLPHAWHLLQLASPLHQGVLASVPSLGRGGGERCTPELQPLVPDFPHTVVHLHSTRLLHIKFITVWVEVAPTYFRAVHRVIFIIGT
jgi:hypothetical protein